MAENGNGRLTRRLNVLDVFCMASGAMVSSGLFVLPGLAYAEAESAMILAYILAGVLVVPALLAKAELATAMPKAGGDYFFVARSMGSAAGTIGGLASWFSLSLKSAFALVGIGYFAALVLPMTPFQAKLMAVAFCVLFVVINLLSVRVTASVQNVLVLSLLGLLVLYIVRGSFSVDMDLYKPSKPVEPSSVFAVAGLVFVAFGGLTKIASVAEEVRNPTRTLPYGLILSFCTILLFYGLTVSVTVGVVPGDELRASRTPISLGAERMLGPGLGPVGRVVMAIAAILAFVSTANAGILSASRFPLAMSRDRLLPQIFSRVNRRFRTPHVAIIATGTFMTAVILALDLETLVKVASTMKIILFMFVILACIIMRESRILNYRPTFSSPLYPWIHVAGLVCYCFLLYAMGTVALVATGVFILAGILWYRLYTQGTAARRSALIHIVERVTDKEIAGDSLSVELGEVLRERDGIVEDRFDRLVRGCPVLDLEAAMTFEEFFAVVAEQLAEPLEESPARLLDALVSREKETTTEISPGLAIPHVVIGGERKFGLLIARCEAGITFNEDMAPVYAAFVLMGSADERTFHLRALSAIAQIVNGPTFSKDWLTAKSTRDLRDIVLLAKRRRLHG